MSGSSAGGGEFQPSNWLRTDDALAQAWDSYAPMYMRRVAAQPPQGSLKKCDLGSFYLGSTCLRKAKLTFVASTLMFEQMLSFDTFLNTRTLRHLH